MRPILALALALVPSLALAQAMPIRKEKGQTCPTGYYASGSDFCAPFNDAKPAVARRKGESCPSGTYTSGGGCVSFR